jgi:hypothetical protein
MADFTRTVQKYLSENGCYFVRNGKGDHKIWHSPITGRNFSMDGKIKKRTSANKTLKEAGLNIKV